MQSEAVYRPVRMGEMRATLTEGANGIRYVRSSETLGPYPRAMTDMLARWAAERPDQVFLADRGPDGDWRRVTYAQARQTVQSLAQALLDAGLDAEKPLLILSGNEIEHALLGYAAMLVGVPHAPLSPAYSLVSKDFAKLKHIVRLIEPGMVYASDGERFAPALSAALDAAVPVVVRTNPAPGRKTLLWDDLAKTLVTPAVAAANARHARHGGQAALHLGFDRHAQGGDHHPAHADLQPGDDPHRPRLPRR